MTEGLDDDLRRALFDEYGINVVDEALEVAINSEREMQVNRDRWQEARDRLRAALAARSEPLDVNGPGCDHECHTDPDMDPAVCDHCTGKSEQERACSEPRAGTYCTMPHVEGQPPHWHTVVYATPPAEALRERVPVSEADMLDHQQRTGVHGDCRYYVAATPPAEGLPAHLWPTESGHRLEPRCRELMPSDGNCDCGERQYRSLLAATPPAEGLDVEPDRDTERIRDPKAWWAGYLAGYRARSREYAATPPAEGLDVDRLTTALWHVSPDDDVERYAVAVAAEYAALAPEQPE